MEKDYYEILQVHPGADARVIKNAYRTLLHELKMHPDLGGSTEAAQKINEAYETLSDTGRRARYDRLLAKTNGHLPARASPRDVVSAAQAPRDRTVDSLRYFKWLGWAGVAVGVAYSGRELLAVSRLTERAAAAPAALAALAAPAATPAPAARANTRFDGFYSTSSVAAAHEPSSLLLDQILGTPASASASEALGAKAGLMKVAPAGPARASPGGGVIIDKKHRWEILPQAAPPAPRASAASVRAAPESAATSVAPAGDPAALSRRRENALHWLRWMGVLAVLLLVW